MLRVGTFFGRSVAKVIAGEIECQVERKGRGTSEDRDYAERGNEGKKTG